MKIRRQKMKNSVILLSLLLTGSLMALSMDEAVEKAIEQSHQLKSQEYKIESSRANEEVLNSTYRPSLSAKYDYTTRDPGNFMRLKNESNINVSLKYNLFNGFYDKYTIESQEHVTDSEAWMQRSNVADLKQLTKQRYLTLLQAGKNKTVQDEAVELLESQLKDTQNLLTQGLIDRSKYLKVKVELQNAKQAQLQANSNVINAKNALVSLVQENIAVESLEEPFKNEHFGRDFETLYTQSLEKRSEIKYLEALKRSQESSIKAVDSVYYPKIDLSLDYNKLGDTVIPDGVSYGTLGSVNDEVVGKVSFSYDLYSGGKANSTRKRNRAQLMSIVEDIEKTKVDIKLQLQQALEQLKVTQGQIEVAQLSIEEAEENYRITNNRYKQQLDSTTDLLDARLLLTTAKNSLALAEYNYLLAVVDVERVVWE
jgi:outer membrane protein TolC